ncbi:MAG: helix-turn-helix transcriptional regulator [Oscillospiraceae bacterium]|nr:helix-turn-helix transcriptional regulator [Oscillospiraceae bacterium]
MPKSSYASFNEEKYHSAFATVLREELLKTPEDVKELAEFLQISPQAVNQFKQGQSFPKIENLIKIAQHFNCSLDYLIGLSDVRSPEADLQAVCDYTGLSEESISKLHKEAQITKKRRKTRTLSMDEDWVRSIDMMITKQPKLFEMISDYLYNTYDRFILPTGENNKSYPVVILKHYEDNGYSNSKLVIPEEVQELDLLRIEKYLREFRQAVQKGEIERPQPV